MKERIYLKMSDSNYQKLIRRVNYLGSTRTNVILMSLFLYQDSDLTEEQVYDNLTEIDFDTEQHEFYFEINSYFLTIFKNKQRYLFSLDEYLAAFLNALLNEDDDTCKEADTKQPKIRRVYHIDESLEQWLSSFSEETGIVQTTLLNYSFMYRLSDYQKRSNESNKVKKGLFLTQPSLDYLQSFEDYSVAEIIENHIKALKGIAAT
ncbi:hypothetical protein CV769_14990 [Enterococcus mundtii]|uniref:hypothetical protein n=1 Tax=Enterococcus mundtii TaxID=53346 RepID=UPI000C25F992|nr:hypothetical protein [Enterococcus mundtii]PJK24535.1 hypothetical protein CV769_14990 [Enterococcus mundtii]